MGLKRGGLASGLVSAYLGCYAVYCTLPRERDAFVHVREQLITHDIFYIAFEPHSELNMYLGSM